MEAGRDHEHGLVPRAVRRAPRRADHDPRRRAEEAGPARSGGELEPSCAHRRATRRWGPGAAECMGERGRCAGTHRHPQRRRRAPAAWPAPRSGSRRAPRHPRSGEERRTTVAGQTTSTRPLPTRETWPGTCAGSWCIVADRDRQIPASWGCQRARLQATEHERGGGLLQRKASAPARRRDTGDVACERS